MIFLRKEIGLRQGFLRFYFVVLLLFTYACGAPDSAYTDRSDPTADAGSSASPPAGVTLGGEPGRSGSVTPAGVPQLGASGGPFVLKFYVTLDTSKASGGTFIYDKSKWALWVGNSSSSQTRLLLAKDFELSDATEARSTGRVGLIQVSVTLGQPLPESLVDKSGGRRRLWFELFYSPEGKGPTEPPSIRGEPPLVLQMKDDVGAIRLAPSLKLHDLADGALGFSVERPPSTESEVVSSGQVVAVAGETSQVSGYIMVLWDNETCAQAAQNGDSQSWAFLPNPVYQESQGASAPQSCSFPGQVLATGSAGCSLGCSSVPGFAGVSLEDVAIPQSIPTSNGWQNAVQVGCYKVARFPADQNSIAVSGLTNGKSYGAFVYALDGSGKLSRSRSACVQASPESVVLGSVAKSPDLAQSKSKSDCFVASASLGTHSPAVFRWQIIRDAYLQNSVFHKLYMFYGPQWARWIELHPGPRFFVGKLIDKSSVLVSFLDAQLHRLSQAFDWLKARLRAAWGSEARAQESAAEAHSQTPPSSLANSSHENGERVGPSSRFGVGASYLKLIQDTPLYDTYYPKRRPLGFFVQQSFFISEALPYLAAGAGARYVTLRGRTPHVGSGGAKPLQIYSFGAYGLLEALFWKTPLVQPRVSVRAGVERFREESSSSALSAEETLSPMGITRVKPMIGLDLALGTSLLQWSQSARQARFGYGLSDMLLEAQLGYTADLEKKSLSLSALEFGLGFDLLVK